LKDTGIFVLKTQLGHFDNLFRPPILSGKKSEVRAEIVVIIPKRFIMKRFFWL